MTANEAFHIAKSFNDSKDASQLKKVKADIRSAADKGKYEIILYHRISKIVRELLVKDNYSVGKEITDRDGDVNVIISWKINSK